MKVQKTQDRHTSGSTW